VSAGNGDDAAVVVQRVLPASPDVVFLQWVDPEAFAEWMCPRPARPTGVSIDARVGGRLRLDIEELGTRFAVTGTYLEVRPPHRLRFTWTCTTWDEPGDSVVTVTLEPHGADATLMTIHHALLPPAQVANHQVGWATIADQLADALAGWSERDGVT
jgi:uncharacterized protein YndB with AHSA1/START domain